MVENTDHIIIEILEEAIQLETEGEQYYKNAVTQTTDRFSKNLLQRLAEDETEHRNILAKELKRIKEGASQLKENEWIDMKTFTDNRIKIFPSDPEILKQEINRDKENMAVLKTAVQKEEESISLYSDSAARVEDEGVRKFLDFMADMEKTHKRILSDYLAYLEEPDAGWDNLERWACQT